MYGCLIGYGYVVHIGSFIFEMLLVAQMTQMDLVHYEGVDDVVDMVCKIAWMIVPI